MLQVLRDSLEYLLYIFVNDNKSELERLYLEDEVMAEVQEKLYTLTEALDSLLYYDPEELRKEALYEEGLEMGTSNTKREIAKSMLKKKMNINDILEITGLTREEILDLEKD